MSTQIVHHKIKELIQQRDNNHRLAWVMIFIICVICIAAGIAWGFGTFLAVVLSGLFGSFTGVFAAWFTLGDDLKEVDSDA